MFLRNFCTSIWSHVLLLVLLSRTHWNFGSVFTLVVLCLIKGRRRHRWQPQLQATQQQINKVLQNLPRMRAESHTTESYLAVAWSQATRVERIGPVLFKWCAVLLQPITVQAAADADFLQNGGPCGTL